jgi:uncharacterized protein (UPF0210 family)
MEEVVDLKSLFNIRTVTCFLDVQASDLDGVDTDTTSSSSVLARKIAEAASLLRRVEEALVQQGYTVQTVRIATNPFGEWLPMEDLEEQLARLDSILASHEIEFCSLGPARTLQELEHYCCTIVKSSPRFSCSANLTSADVVMAKAAARCILKIAHLGSECDGAHVQDGLGNFRFCVASSCKDYIPFFPVAKCASSSTASTEVGLKFAVGLENGSLAHHLLSKCQSIANVRTTFRSGMAQAIEPVQTLCQSLAVSTQSEYLGVDTSLNPSLDEAGSVARAMEALDEVAVFGGHGTIAAAAVITECLQNLPGIQRTGYCGLMLPLCEDQRLAELAGEGTLRISDLLSVSNVCGVGVDTVPLPGDCTESQLTALLLDVAGIADRWNKSLSCRVFPIPGMKAGDLTNLVSPHMINARILSLA